MTENTLYTKAGCVYCDRVKEHLKNRAVSYTEVRIDHSVENLDELKSRLPGVKTVPQFFVGSVHVGGCDETIMYLADVYGPTNKSIV